ncbi:hypothetical protein ABZZ74_22100 [Streptomyces sp. NPDC006476]|uniref:hypothetical protein n=1 Tax=Streptomyces sp. NPDC006476 TaxID=3157175 RepID=UPI0033AAFEBD
MGAYLRRVMINTRTQRWRAGDWKNRPPKYLPDQATGDYAEQHAIRALLMHAAKALAPQQRSVLILQCCA